MEFRCPLSIICKINGKEFIMNENGRSERLKIRAAFLDEITADIPALNYDREAWDAEFAEMKKAEITDAVMIRCGHKKLISYPSKVLMKKCGCYEPPEDLPSMFLELAEKHGLNFWFGSYFSGNDWLEESYDVNRESDLMNEVNDEFYERAGKYSSAFGGWYFSQEISTSVSHRVVDCYCQMGAHCRELTPGLPRLISPGFPGHKTPSIYQMSAEDFVKDWDGIFEKIAKDVDIVAFQDGHCTLDELEFYLGGANGIARKHGLKLWTNLESFDRDVTGAFPPIRWEKLYYKMKIAEKVGVNEAITFDFAHFFSPLNGNVAAGNLLKKYLKYRNS